MEASSRPQLPLDDTGEGSVRALGDRLVIERLQVDDPRAAKLVRDRAEAGRISAPDFELATPADEIAEIVAIACAGTDVRG